jgi:enterochelin esterase-like enzyme
MPEHNFSPTMGLLERFSFNSELLTNSIGDPLTREVLVHIPLQGLAAIDQGECLPVMIYLAPFTSSGLARAGWRAFSETLPQRHERLVNDGIMKPTILVMPDCFTSLGGNQFVDSPILGKWSSWLNGPLKNELSQRYSTNGKFALFGKSSGGYGALHNALHHPGQWHAIASHSGDAGFENLYQADFHKTATRINRVGNLEKFLNYVKDSGKLSGDDFHALMICAMSASYSNTSRLTLPFDLKTCTVDLEIWDNWKKYDPVESVKIYHKSLSSLKMLFIDCGNTDQYGIQYGSRVFVELLTQYGIDHHWEEFQGTHSGIDYRLDCSMPLLAEALYS